MLESARTNIRNETSSKESGRAGGPTRVAVQNPSARSRNLNDVSLWDRNQNSGDSVRLNFDNLNYDRTEVSSLVNQDQDFI